MPRFHYVALDARGRESAGRIEAPDQNGAVGQLRQAGLFPTHVVAEDSAASNGARRRPFPRTVLRSQADGAVQADGRRRYRHRRVRAKVLMVFTRQLATLIDAGLPLLRGLAVLERQERDPTLRATIARLAGGVQGGGTFSETLAQHPKVFSPLYVNMVRAGELGGVLEVVLLRLAEFQEKAQRLRHRVQAAMVYPAVVLTVAVAITFFLLTVIVPKFEAIFQDMLNGRPLPALTQGVIGVSRFCQDYWYTLLGGTFLVVLGFQLFRRRPSGRRTLDRLVLRAPLFGDLILKSATSRFARTLGTLVTSGVPILQALLIARDTAGNTVVAGAIARVHDAVKEGERLVQPLEASRVFPPMVVSMVDVGEETGRLPEMLLKIAEVYDDEVDHAVAGLTSLLEPVMIVGLAFVVGTIVIALFLPLIAIIGGMQGGGEPNG